MGFPKEHTVWVRVHAPGLHSLLKEEGIDVQAPQRKRGALEDETDYCPPTPSPAPWPKSVLQKEALGGKMPF